jgi:hypothetical protein
MLFESFKGNASTRYDIENENIAKEQLEKVIEKEILPVGLIIDKNQPFLAVSSDGLS